MCESSLDDDMTSLSKMFWPLGSHKINQTLLSFDRVTIRLLVGVMPGHRMIGCMILTYGLSLNYLWVRKCWCSIFYAICRDIDCNAMIPQHLNIFPELVYF